MSHKARKQPRGTATSNHEKEMASAIFSAVPEMIGKMLRAYHLSTRRWGKAPAQDAAKVSAATAGKSHPAVRFFCLLKFLEILTLGLTIGRALCYDSGLSSID